MTSGKKILIVDDKKLNRKMLESYLISAGYTEILQAASGLEAMEIVKRARPDLILLDIVMPGMDGFEVCRLLKSGEETRIVPVIMVTALEDRESKLKCLEIGADDFLSKPVDPMELLARVKSLLRVKDYFQQLRELNDNLLSNMKTAQRIQQALLPPAFPNLDGILFHAHYQPAELLGGDYYNVFPFDEDNVCLYVADVTGHQLDAAMLTVFIKEAIAGYSRKTWGEKQKFSPRDCLLSLEQAFKRENFPADIFITIFLAGFNYSSKKLTCSAAGFAQPALIYGGEKMPRELSCPGSPIMLLGDGNDFEEQTVVLQPGEGVFIYTDGIVEQTDAGGEELFGQHRLEELLSGITEKKVPQLIPDLLEALGNFAGTKRFSDDIALLNMFVQNS